MQGHGSSLPQSANINAMISSNLLLRFAPKRHLLLEVAVEIGVTLAELGISSIRILIRRDESRIEPSRLITLRY